MQPIAQGSPSVAVAEHLATADARARHFATLLDEHAGIVRKVAATYCRDGDDRADLAQEIASALWQAFARYDATRPFATWMYRIALNVAISHVRSTARRRRVFVPLDEGLQESAEAVADADSGAALATLQRHRRARPDEPRAARYADDRVSAARPSIDLAAPRGASARSPAPRRPPD